MTFIRSAKVLVIDKEGNVLILRRSETHPTAAFEPDLPGGIVEEHETIEEGVIRELREETGMILHENQIIDAHEKITENFGLTHVDRDLFIVHIDSVKPDITISWEHDKYDWIPIHEVTGLEYPIQGILEDVIRQSLWKRA